MVWEAYFDIFPFTQDREDRRFAMLASVIANTSGKSYKDPFPESFFLPDYLQDQVRTVVPVRSIEVQTQEALAFRQRLAEVKK